MYVTVREKRTRFVRHDPKSQTTRLTCTRNDCSNGDDAVEEDFVLADRADRSADNRFLDTM